MKRFICGIVLIASLSALSTHAFILAGILDSQDLYNQLTVTPTSWTFANTSTGMRKFKTFTFGNSPANVVAEGISVSVSGAGFSNHSSAAFSNLSAGSTRSYTVAFSPLALGNYSGSLTATWPNRSNVVAKLYGTGTATGPTYTLQQSLGDTPDNSIVLGDNAITTFIAGSFTTNDAYTLKQVGIFLRTNSGAPLTTAISCSIYSDTGGSGPAVGSGLATSTNTHSDTLTSSYVEYLFQFSGLPLSNETRYWVSCGNSIVDATNYSDWSSYDGGTESQYRSGNPTSYWLSGYYTGQLSMRLYK